jgi:alanyl-tRNA synthetase
MKKYGTNELREMFLSFYEDRGHLRLESFPLVPQNDASLLLINSGMAPMKPWFTGEQEPPRKRVTTCQKCIRTGDIENVGKTSRHGTYFEMLGNFSFGDYFKEEAIQWYWEFLTKAVGIDESLLYPSVYEEDDEAYNIWRDKMGIAPERIFRLGKDDNFWDVGAGPCGPCSEVFFDRGEKNGCGSPTCAPGCDCDRFVEIGNNVFTQFSNDGEGNYTQLKQKNIDFGGGLERLAVVCQGVDSLFEIDTVMKIIDKISELSNAQYKKDEKADISIRVIADHTRSATMMICDGVLPSNEGRGYVLRRLLRRAARHGRFLGIKEAFLQDVCAVVISENESAYPDLSEKAGFIKRVISAEEESFGKTIDNGMSILSGLITKYKESGNKVFSGEDAFKLYDTYGFPPDVTAEILDEHGISVDEGSFAELMEAQRVRARKAREALGEQGWQGVALPSETPDTEFVGYDVSGADCEVVAIISEGESAGAILEGGEGLIVLDKTPFYAEKGGQSADCGHLRASNDSVFEVTDVIERGGKYLHKGLMRGGKISVGAKVKAEIDTERREAISRAHTATHVLHAALQDVLGDHVRQAGSLVEPDRLRFDFTHFNALTAEELTLIEDKVNQILLSGYKVFASEMSMNEAKQLGAAALFGEKYGDVVRVVEIGDAFSAELCGGTHLDITAKVGAFYLQSEFSVASGVRRIEATTGKATLKTMSETRQHLARVAEMVKAPTPESIFEKLEISQATGRELRAKLDAALIKESRDEAARIMTYAVEVKGLMVVAKIIEDADIDVERLRKIEDTLREWQAGVVGVLATIKDDKITIMAACGQEAVARGIKAGDIIKEVTKICGGSGGGKPEFAMGGGKNPDKLGEALGTVEEYVRENVK